MGTQMVPGRRYFERATDLDMDTTDMVPKPPSPTGFRVTTDMPIALGIIFFSCIAFAILYIIYRCSEFGCRMW